MVDDDQVALFENKLKAHEYNITGLTDNLALIQNTLDYIIKSNKIIIDRIYDLEHRERNFGLHWIYLILMFIVIVMSNIDHHRIAKLTDQISTLLNVSKAVIE